MMEEEIKSKGNLLREYIGNSHFDEKIPFVSSIEVNAITNADATDFLAHLNSPKFLDLLLIKLNVQIVKTLHGAHNTLQNIASFILQAANIVFTILEKADSRSQSFAGDVFAGIFQLLMWLKEQTRHGEILAGVILEIIEHKLLNGLAATIFSRNSSTRPTSMGDVVDIPLDDTTGWRHLEAYLFSLQTLTLTYLEFGRSFPFLGALPPTTLAIIQEYDNIAYPIVTIADLLICYASTHVNRYIREMTLRFIEQLFSSQSTQQISTDSRNLFIFDSQKYFSSSRTLSNDRCRLFSNISSTKLIESEFLPMVVRAVSRGLEDDWSQNRLVATKACRVVLISVADTPRQRDTEEEIDAAACGEVQVLAKLCWPSLLPRVCMNRYYAAEAVKSASLNIWREFIATRFNGKELLAQNCSAAVQYYINCSQKSTNHMVCEAACHAMGEISSRIDPTCVEPYIPGILRELRCRLEDERWPVSDAACCAIGAVIAACPAVYLSTVHAEGDDVMVKLLSKQLLSCIPSVRDNAAVAMGKIMSCLEPSLRRSATDRAIGFMQENLLLLQILDSTSALPPGTVVPLQGDEGMIVGKNGQVIKSFLPVSMLSSGGSGGGGGALMSASITTGYDSVAVPSRGSSYSRARWSCCIDCVELRTSEPWERSHAAVCLVREAALSSMNSITYLPSDDIIQELLRPHFSPSLKYCSHLPATLLTDPLSILDALWLILSHRISASSADDRTKTDSKSLRRAASSIPDPSTRNKIRNLEKLQAAVYNEVPLILLGLLPGRNRVEDLASSDCCGEDIDILRKIHFYRCIKAYLSDVKDFRTLSSVKQVALEEAAAKLNLLLHEDLLHTLLLHEDLGAKSVLSSLT